MGKNSRSNEAWLQDLKSSGKAQAAALADLRELLLRASLVTFNRYLEDLAHRDPQQIFDLAEDCSQDALMAILRRLNDFRGESLFTTWAYKFAVNIALTTARRERYREISFDGLSSDDDQEPVWLAADFSPEGNPSLLARRQEVEAVIRQVLQEELTPRQRLVLKLIVFEDVPMDVVVERLGSNRNAIYKMLHDARKKLKQALLAQGFDVDEMFELFAAGR